jgi:hypothetical protein
LKKLKMALAQRIERYLLGFQARVLPLHQARIEIWRKARESNSITPFEVSRFSGPLPSIQRCLP